MTQPTLPRISRRRFIGGAATTVGALAVGGPAALGARRNGGHEHDHDPGFDHVVVVMMENRSFDHLLGWLQGRRRPAGRPDVPRRAPASRTPRTRWRPTSRAADIPTPTTPTTGGRVEYNGGACDGWLRAGQQRPVLAIGYYQQADLAFLGQAAPRWTTLRSRYFAAILAETFPNRIYQHAAQTDRIDEHRDTCRRCRRSGIAWPPLGCTGRYYFSDVPFLALWGGKYIAISRPSRDVLRRLRGRHAAARLLRRPALPRTRAPGTSNDDHPHADIRNGEAFMNHLHGGHARARTGRAPCCVINYDEWGGFFDHVPPPAAPIPAADAAAGNADGLRGFRVPCVMVSPRARRAHVSHRVYDHTSILKMIERRWGLPPLSVRDASANDLGRELSAHRRSRAVAIDVPQGPFAGACPAPAAGAARAGRTKGSEWRPLLDLARRTGWPV